ncbi:MAG: HD domain-containing protein [Pseudomonadota bacterium]|nr:HD domain-containing protein [Pseudomonadota bacterium]QKK06389.1 MAG: HD domain-containing protein [Pseudomonadota bacterium]
MQNWQQIFENWWHDNAADDAAHDLGHFRRVYKIALHIATQESEKSDPLVLLAAAYFHDVVNPPKNSDLRSKASTLSAEKAAEILAEMTFPQEKIPDVQHAIAAHSFSANIPAETIEAKIIQDADRMESLGAMGVARTMYVSGRLGRSLFHPDDPLAESARPLDDKEYGLDHFALKLMKLPAMMQTESGRRLATERAAYLEDFRAQLAKEISADF